MATARGSLAARLRGRARPPQAGGAGGSAGAAGGHGGSGSGRPARACVWPVGGAGDAGAWCREPRGLGDRRLLRGAEARARAGRRAASAPRRREAEASTVEPSSWTGSVPAGHVGAVLGRRWRRRGTGTGAAASSSSGAAVSFLPPVAVGGLRLRRGGRRARRGGRAGAGWAAATCAARRRPGGRPRASPRPRRR